MVPLTIGLAIESKPLSDEVQQCLEGLPVRVITQQHDTAALLEEIKPLHPDVILIDISHFNLPLEPLLRQIKADSAGSMIIVLHTSAEPEKILAAMRAGAHEYLFPPLQTNLRAALERKSEEHAASRDGIRGKGKTIAFVSAKGGCGATTVACHVAVELGRRSAQRVLLADLDLNSGTISFVMRSKSPYTVLDAIHNLHRLDPSYWKALVSNGYPGLEVISAPPPAGFAGPPPDPEQLRHVLSFARSNYEWTVVDLGRSLSPLAMTAFEEIDEVYLISTMDMPALHAAAQIARALVASNYGRNRVRLVLNRTPSDPDTTLQDLEKALAHPVFAMLPDDYTALCDSYCEGRLLGSSSQLARHLAKLAHKIAGLPEEKSKGRFTLFKSRN